MRVGDVARETLAAPAPTLGPEGKPPPKLPVPTDKNNKTSTSTASTSMPARAGNPPPGKAGEGGGGKPDTDAGGSATASADPPKGVHAAVVDSASNLSEAEVRTTIVQRQASFRQCYDLGASSSSGAFSGTINLRVSIGPTGTVASVDVLTSTTKLASVDSCVTQAVRSIQFPAKGNGAVVAFPIEFGK
jgi:outer membrane biosynthesis protein TonB